MSFAFGFGLGVVGGVIFAHSWSVNVAGPAPAVNQIIRRTSPVLRPVVMILNFLESSRSAGCWRKRQAISVAFRRFLRRVGPLWHELLEKLKHEKASPKDLR